MAKEPTMDYTIVNIVASGYLRANLDLYNLAVSIPNIEYEPEQFPGAILKLQEPKVSMLLFKNGKIIISGASSEAQIEQGIRKASKLIHEVQPSVKVVDKCEYTVVNLVATGNLHQNLDLFKTALNLDNVEYEPEQFPGAILRLSEPKLTLLLFKNGKVICAGAKREELLRQGLVVAQKLIKQAKAESAYTEEDEEEMEEKEQKWNAPKGTPTKPAKVVAPAKAPTKSAPTKATPVKKSSKPAQKAKGKKK